MRAKSKVYTDVQIVNRIGEIGRQRPPVHIECFAWDPTISSVTEKDLWNRWCHACKLVGTRTQIRVPIHIEYDPEEWAAYNVIGSGCVIVYLCDSCFDHVTYLHSKNWQMLCLIAAKKGVPMEIQRRIEIEMYRIHFGKPLIRTEFNIAL